METEEELYPYTKAALQEVGGQRQNLAAFVWEKDPAPINVFRYEVQINSGFDTLFFFRREQQCIC